MSRQIHYRIREIEPGKFRAEQQQRWGWREISASYYPALNQLAFYKGIHCDGSLKDRQRVIEEITRRGWHDLQESTPPKFTPRVALEATVVVN